MSIAKIAPFGSDAFMPQGRGFNIGAFKNFLDADNTLNSENGAISKGMEGFFRDLSSKIAKNEAGALAALSGNSVEDAMFQMNGLQLNAKALSKISGLLVNSANELLKMQI